MIGSRGFMSLFQLRTTDPVKSPFRRMGAGDRELIDWLRGDWIPKSELTHDVIKIMEIAGDRIEALLAEKGLR